MVPFPRVAVHLLLVGKILLPTEDEQGADRRFVIAPAGDCRNDDAPGAGGVDLVGAGPTSPQHCRVHRRLGTEQSHIDGIAQQPIARARSPDEIVGQVDLAQDPVQPGQDQVGEDRPEDDGEPPMVPLEAFLKQESSKPDGSKAAEDKQRCVEGTALRGLIVRHGARPGRGTGHGSRKASIETYLKGLQALVLSWG